MINDKLNEDMIFTLTRYQQEYVASSYYFKIYSPSYKMESRQIQPSKNLYPYCVLWSPLPPITWLFPFIGHTGIADSQGIIHDFAGPYHIGVGKMAFGSPTRYIQLDPEMCKNMSWDDGLQEGCTICTLHEPH